MVQNENKNEMFYNLNLAKFLEYFYVFFLFQYFMLLLLFAFMLIAGFFKLLF
jgi:hypothetical protein